MFTVAKTLSNYGLIRLKRFVSQISYKLYCRCFGPGGPQPSSEFVLRAPDPDGDAKRHKVYTGSDNQGPTSSLRDRSCIPYTEVLVVGGYKQGEKELVLGLGGVSCGPLETLLSGGRSVRVCVGVTRCSPVFSPEGACASESAPRNGPGYPLL